MATEMNEMATETTNNLKGSIEDIYKEHNGLILEGYLKALTFDDSFKLSELTSNKYTFENEIGEIIVIDSNGELCNDVNVNSKFLQISKWRLGRTNKMINMLYN